MRETSTEHPRIVSRAEWLRARRVLLLLEADAARSPDDASAQRRRMPMVKIEHEYIFDGPSGATALLDLFSDNSCLVVHHIVWSDARDEIGSACAALIERRDYSAQLDATGCALAFVSRAPIEQLDAYRARMEWCTTLHSSARTTFHYDFNATVNASRGATMYNYRDVSMLGGLWSGYVGDVPGASVFRRVGDDVYHHYSAYARGMELSGRVLDFVETSERSPARGWTRRVESAMIAG